MVLIKNLYVGNLQEALRLDHSGVVVKMSTIH